MTDRLIATARWRRLDEPGQETCRLLQTADGWRLEGHAEWESGKTDYAVICDANWQTIGANVTGQIEGTACTWRITRSPNGWALNGSRTDLQAGPDIDLAMTPATNTLPIRRLGLQPGQDATQTAAWFRPENGGSLSELPQTYACQSGIAYTYTSANFHADLDIHPSGLIIRYGDLWAGEVTDG